MVEILLLAVFVFHIVSLVLLVTSPKWVENLLLLTPPALRGQQETTTEEIELCTCGEPLEDCPDAYAHVTSGA